MQPTRLDALAGFGCALKLHRQLHVLRPELQHLGMANGAVTSGTKDVADYCCSGSVVLIV
jgi:hypothetical protein